MCAAAVPWACSTEPSAIRMPVAGANLTSAPADQGHGDAWSDADIALDNMQAVGGPDLGRGDRAGVPDDVRVVVHRDDARRCAGETPRGLQEVSPQLVDAVGRRGCVPDDGAVSRQPGAEGDLPAGANSPNVNCEASGARRPCSPGQGDVAMKNGRVRPQPGVVAQPGTEQHTVADRLALPCRVERGMIWPAGVPPPVVAGIHQRGRRCVVQAGSRVGIDPIVREHGTPVQLDQEPSGGAVMDRRVANPHVR